MREQRPNIVFIISHDLGQHLGCYRALGVRTPHIDSLAAGGTRFVRSFCTAPQCSPSRAALWTGRYPHANGVVGLTHGEFANDLNENEVHLAEMLTDSGYETRLFGVQHESPVPERLGYQHIHPTGRADSVGREAAEFLQNRSELGKPFFTSVGFFEPHRPFHHEGVVPSSLESVSVPPCHL